jgi:hypothetical protein
MKYANITLSTLLLFSLSSTLVHADFEHEREHGNQRQRPGQGAGQSPIGFPSQQPSRPTTISNVELQVNNYFQGQAQLDLLQDFYISNQLNGQRIQDISIIASTEAGRGEAQLLLNGQQLEQGKTVSQGMNTYTFIVDPFANMVGQSLRTISLNLRGRFFIQKVIFNLAQQGQGGSWPNPYPMPVPQPRNEIVRQIVNESITEEGGIELFRLFNLGMVRQGQTVKRITITGRSNRGFGMADLQINGQIMSAPQRLAEYQSTLTFDLASGSRIGQEIRSLQIHLRGMVQIDEVTIEIENQATSLPRRFEQVVNQRLYDTNGIELSRLAMIPANLNNQMVDSVELTLRNGDMGTKLSLCQVQLGQYQRIDCGAQVFVSQGRQVIRLTLPSAARLQEISLSVRMGMIDVDAIAINFR